MLLAELVVWHTRRLVRQREAFETALEAEQRRLAWQASHDSLTDLANRREFETRLKQALDCFQPGDTPFKRLHPAPDPRQRAGHAYEQEECHRPVLQQRQQPSIA